MIRTAVQLLAGIPSVVYGLVGMIVLVPGVQRLFSLSSGATLFSAILVLAVMILPSIINVSETALRAVPREYEEASQALGATELETYVRVSLPAAPEEEVKAGIAILKAAGLRCCGVKVISCPTCGRTQIDLISTAKAVEAALSGCKRDITVAVMGCIVNGPGEAREADFGLAGGKGEAMLFRKGEIVGKAAERDMIPALLKLIEEN